MQDSHQAGLPGASVTPQGVTVQVWSPEHESIELVANDGKRTGSLIRNNATGVHSATFDWLAAGDLYQFRIDGSDRLFPDPASRFQPQGPHGPSEVIDPSVFRWQQHSTWKYPDPKGQVIYELHIGTFTPEGTWAAATA